MPIASSAPVRRRIRTAGGAVGALAVAAVGVVALCAPAQAGRGSEPPELRHAASFPVTANLAPGEDPATPTSAEIIDVTDDGRTAVYTDAFTGRLGLLDVSRPERPRALGAVDLPGDPTSVAIHRGWALVALSTGSSLDEPDGVLAVVDLRSRAVVRTIALGGQPDSVAVSPNGGRYAAVTIENERDEDEGDGLLPQSPAGRLAVVDLGGRPDRWTVRAVDLTGLALVAPEDPEPEYVDINGRDQAVVSLQENNHLVVVDLRRARVVRHFSAGTADVRQVGTVEEELGPQGAGLIELTGALQDRRREPDSVAWIDDDTFATANEGDYTDADGVEGGTRSVTLFHVSGRVERELGNEVEHELVRAGHYPEARSENKGVEPEGLEVGRYGGRTLLLVGAERANAVVVYDVTSGRPTFRQVLPTGIGPEGLTFTSRGTLLVTSEVDGADEGFPARPLITVFTPGRATYPQVRSVDDAAGAPIPWVALSGLAGDPADPDVVWAVSDSALAQAFLYRLDVSRRTAVITDRVAVGGVDVADQEQGDYDLEGVAVRPEGGFWLGSEGRTNAGSSRPNLLVRTDADGAVLDAVRLPDTLVAGATSSGIEGVAVTGTQAGGDEVVWVALQRGWADDAPGEVKIGRYDVAAGAWTFARYPLDAVASPAGGWVGLSEVTALPDGRLLLVERDNQLGTDARVKRLYAVDPAAVELAPHGSALPLVTKSLVRDVLPDLDRASITVPEKLEGVALTADGRLLAVTDNDGLDESYGETVLVELPHS